jgi:hypothetical protein
VFANQSCVFQSVLASPFDEKPVTATTMPVTVTPSSATNLRNMRPSLTRVPSLVETQLSSVTAMTPTRATALLTHGLISTASAPRTARTRYSPMMMEMIAALPGLSTSTATQVKRKPASSPKILAR